MNKTPLPKPNSGLGQAHARWKAQRKAELAAAAAEQARLAARPWVIQTGANPKVAYSTVLETTNEAVARLRFATYRAEGGKKKRLLNPEGVVITRVTSREV